MSLSALIRQAMENRLAGVHTALPGEIRSYDAATQKASIKPLIKREYKDGDAESLPIINNCPVIQYAGGGGMLSFPIKKGDTGLIVFSERSLDAWLSGGNKEVSPGDRRKHDLSDAIFISGLYSFNGTPGLADSDNAVLSFGEAKIQLDTDNKIAIGNSQAELLDLFEQTLAAIEAMTTTTSLGPQPPLNLLTFTAIKAELNKIKGSL